MNQTLKNIQYKLISMLCQRYGTSDSISYYCNKLDITHEKFDMIFFGDISNVTLGEIVEICHKLNFEPELKLKDMNNEN